MAARAPHQMKRDPHLAVLYCRVSTDKQEEKGYSLPEQQHTNLEYAASKGYNVIAEFRDSETGTVSTRTGIDALLRAAKEMPFKRVLVKKIDRLGRGGIGFYPVLSQLQELGLEVEWTDENVPENMVGIYVWLAGEEAKKIKERTHAGRVQKARQGTPGPPPLTAFGYDYDPWTRFYVLNPTEAEWVRRIFAWRVEGKGGPEIAHLLNSFNVPVRRQRALRENLARLDDPNYVTTHSIDVEEERNVLLDRLSRIQGWDPKKVRDLLSNTIYYGEGYANRFLKPRGQPQQERPRQEWVRLNYPPIVSREIWDEAQRVGERLKTYRERRSGSESSHDYLLVGLLTCSACNKNFEALHQHNRRRLKDGTWRKYEKGRAYYRCGGMTRFPDLYHCRSRFQLPAGCIEQAVWDHVLQALRQPESIAALASADQESSAIQSHEIGSEQAHIQERLAALEPQMQRLVGLYTKGSIPEHNLELQARVIQEEEGALSARLDELAKQAEQQRNKADLYARMCECRALVSGLPERLTDMTPEQYRRARDVVRTVVDRVWLDANSVMTIDLLVQVPVLSSHDGEVDIQRDKSAYPLPPERLSDYVGRSGGGRA